MNVKVLGIKREEGREESQGGWIPQEPFQFLLEASHSLSYGMTENMCSTVSRRMRLALSLDHGVAIIIGKTNIAVDYTD